MARVYRSYSPATPFATPMYILNPTYTTAKGVRKPSYPDPQKIRDDEHLIFGTFRSYGGTDTTQNDITVVEKTGYIDTWYRPDIKSNTRIYIVGTDDTYEVLGDPEDISMRHQYLKIRVRKIGGAV